MSKNTQVNILEKKFEGFAKQCSSQIFFCGGHGGLVTYDGKGGPMVKEGGPMDRIFLLRNKGDFGGNIGLDILFGSIKFSTGHLAKDVDLSKKGKDKSVVFTFKENQNSDAIEIRGGIPELNLPYSTVLFRASVEPSIMTWIVGSKNQQKNKSYPSGNLPYSAYHLNPYIHPDILKRFGFRGNTIGNAVTGWCKPEPFGMEFEENSKYGAMFRTQQHLGNLRIFI